MSVAAASSLSDVLPRVAAAWKAAGGADVEFSFDASSRLASQITNGAPVDLFFSADEEWMDALLLKGKVDASTRVDLLSNEIVLVVPAASKQKIVSPPDLKSKAVHRFALAAENVPAGRYARRALVSVGVWDDVEAKVVNAANVRQALQLAASGEVEAAIVYRTDALAEPRVRMVFTFPSNSHGSILYPAAVVRGASQAAAAKQFLEFCRSDAAKRLFTTAGFGLVPSK